MYNKCLICGSDFNSLVLNDLPMRQCVNCGLIWREEFNVIENYYQEKDIDFNPNKIQSRILNSKQRIAILKKYADLNNLLDVGTSEGTFLKVLMDSGYRHVMGLEPSIKNFDFVRINNLKVIKGDTNNISEVIAENNINTVTMFHVIEHLPDPLKSLELIFRSLKKGDKLIIETPDIEAYTFKKVNYKTKLIFEEHLFYFNKNNLKNLLVKAGFKILANGKRDFNQYNLSIKECLFRLGLIRKKIDVNLIASDGAEPAVFNTHPQNPLTFIRKIIRKILNYLVIILRRLDYIWIVAEK